MPNTGGLFLGGWDSNADPLFVLRVLNQLRVPARAVTRKALDAVIEFRVGSFDHGVAAAVIMSRL